VNTKIAATISPSVKCEGALEYLLGCVSNGGRTLLEECFALELRFKIYADMLSRFL